MRVVVGLQMVLAGCGASLPAAAPAPPPTETSPPATATARGAPTPSPPPEQATGLLPLFDSEVAWEEVPRTGLEDVVPNRELVPFGRWPDAVYVKAMFEGEHGVYEPRILRFDSVAGRWSPIGFEGDFRAEIDVTRTSPTRWVMIRRGFGVGAHTLIRIGVVGPGLTSSPQSELPCRSQDSRLVLDAPEGIAGGWSLFCVRRDDVSEHMMHFGPDSAAPATGE